MQLGSKFNELYKHYKIYDFYLRLKDDQTAGNTFTMVYRDAIDYCNAEDFTAGKNLG